MFWKEDATSDDEMEALMKIAQKIHEHGMGVPSVMILETLMPLNFIGTQMGRFIISPFLLIFNENIEMSWERIMNIFEKRENVRRLITMVEELDKEEKKKKKLTSAKPEKKGWRRFFPL